MIHFIQTCFKTDLIFYEKHFILISTLYSLPFVLF